MERKLGYAILAAVATFAILQLTIGTASFKPSSTLLTGQIDPAQLRANASLYAGEVALFVAGIVLVFSSSIAGESESTSSNVAASMQNLNALKQKGLITDEEFKMRRTELLKRV